MTLSRLRVVYEMVGSSEMLLVERTIPGRRATINDQQMSKYRHDSRRYSMGFDAEYEGKVMARQLAESLTWGVKSRRCTSSTAIALGGVFPSLVLC